MSYLCEPSSCVIQAPRALSSQTRDLLEELKDSHPGVVYECQRHRRQYGEVEQLLELVTNLGLEHPLAVFGDVGEIVDALLVDCLPAADTQFVADEGDGVVD